MYETFLHNIWLQTKKSVQAQWTNSTATKASLPDTQLYYIQQKPFTYLQLMNLSNKLSSWTTLHAFLFLQQILPMWLLSKVTFNLHSDTNTRATFCLSGHTENFNNFYLIIKFCSILFIVLWCRQWQITWPTVLDSLEILQFKESSKI